MTPASKALIVGGIGESLVRFRGDLIRALQDRGMEVHAAAPGLLPTSAPGQTLESWGVVSHELALERTGLNPLQDLGTALQLLRLLRRIQPTHLLAYTAKPVIYTLLAARLARPLRATALVTGLGYAFTGERDNAKRKLLHALLRALYRAALRGAERVVFQNPDDQGLFIELGLVEPARCGLICGSGVRLDTFSVAPLPPLAPAPHFLMIARLLRDKGVCEFVEAARQVRQSHPDTQFHLVGWLDTNPTSIAPADLDAWVADGSIVYHGRMEDVRSAIASCHAFVLPSYREGTPRSVLEAMAMGRAIITTDVPGCRETVQHGRNGYLVPDRDAPALAEAMLRFVEHPEHLATMGAASRMIAEQKYDVLQVNAHLLEYMGVSPVS